MKILKRCDDFLTCFCCGKPRNRWTGHTDHHCDVEDVIRRLHEVHGELMELRNLKIGPMLDMLKERQEKP